MSIRWYHGPEPRSSTCQAISVSLAVQCLPLDHAWVWIICAASERASEPPRYGRSVENGDIILDDAAESARRFRLTRSHLCAARSGSALHATDVRPPVVGIVTSVLWHDIESGMKPENMRYRNAAYAARSPTVEIIGNDNIPRGIISRSL